MSKNFLFKTFSVLSILSLMIMGAGATVRAAAAPLAQDGEPTIMSDQADYPPGATVTLMGANWQGDTDVHIVVNDDVGQTWNRDVTVAVAGDGTIFDSFQLPSYFVATYRVVASGQQTGRVVTTLFTDLSIGTYDQCSNDLGTGYTTGDTGCRWINGNLQSNNSIYVEKSENSQDQELFHIKSAQEIIQCNFNTRPIFFFSSSHPLLLDS